MISWIIAVVLLMICFLVCLYFTLKCPPMIILTSLAGISLFIVLITIPNPKQETVNKQENTKAVVVTADKKEKITEIEKQIDELQKQLNDLKGE